jgi:glutaredoxin 3
MEFEKPLESGFTIYSKSGCPNCVKAKALLNSKHLLLKVVNCDEYIIEDKESFLSFIANLSNKKVKMFPIVFYDGKFVGGYNETVGFVDELLLAFDANF